MLWVCGVVCWGRFGQAHTCMHVALSRGGSSSAAGTAPNPQQIITQPINALAFLADGVLYGVGGFSYAAVAMVMACLPAGAAMLLGSRLSAGLAAGAAQDGQLIAVWAGLALLMLGRFLTIYVPLVARRPPFDKLEA